MEVATASSAQGGDKYAALSGNHKHAKTGVGHLIVSGMAFSGKRSFCIKDFVDKAKETRGVSKAKRPILISLACQLGF
ncbi:hypothetical protein Pyn_32473 [Prunus yedoensis var. nudiflora]|uniref:Uncharacterized protein n=1 Tax=Prunus yedoensis var. nudiflora TaxID=2094558 RepID=A0A314ZLK7_PRUYE|nr:hypothetical protein Pyn_32473 [Prunus yedoensis var. nudiflora]